MSKRIGAVVTAAVLDGDKDMVTFLKLELARHKVSLAGIPNSSESAKVDDKPLVVPKADPKNPNQIGNMTYRAALERALAAKGDAKRGSVLFKSQSCAACHTTADGQTPKGPHLVDIGKRYSPAEHRDSAPHRPSDHMLTACHCRQRRAPRMSYAGGAHGSPACARRQYCRGR